MNRGFEHYFFGGLDQLSDIRVQSLILAAMKVNFIGKVFNAAPSQRYTADREQRSLHARDLAYIHVSSRALDASAFGSIVFAKRIGVIF